MLSVVLNVFCLCCVSCQWTMIFECIGAVICSQLGTRGNLYCTWRPLWKTYRWWLTGSCSYSSGQLSSGQWSNFLSSTRRKTVCHTVGTGWHWWWSTPRTLSGFLLRRKRWVPHSSRSVALFTVYQTAIRQWWKSRNDVRQQTGFCFCMCSSWYSQRVLSLYQTSTRTWC